MELNKQQTALIQQGSIEEFWLLLFEVAPDCYDSVAEAYSDTVRYMNNNSITKGTDKDGNPVDVSEYPTDRIPPIKKGFDE